jgi:hypothetical protein
MVIGITKSNFTISSKKSLSLLLALIEVEILVGWGSANKIVTDSRYYAY